MEQTQNRDNQTRDNTRHITKIITRTAFLHVEDALAIGKLKFWMGNYKQGEGCQAHATAYLNADLARVVFQDILLRGGLPEAFYPERKLEIFGGSERDGQVECRIVRFREDPTKRAPIAIEISTGPGKRNASGGIQPLGKLETVALLLDLLNARRFASTILAELQAYDVANELQRRLSGAPPAGAPPTREQIVEDF